MEQTNCEYCNSLILSSWNYPCLCKSIASYIKSINLQKKLVDSQMKEIINNYYGIYIHYFTNGTSTYIIYPRGNDFECMFDLLPHEITATEYERAQKENLKYYENNSFKNYIHNNKIKQMLEDK